jgi:hypothetical protein
MNRKHGTDPPREAAGQHQTIEQKKPRKYKWLRRFGIFLLIVVVLLGVGRAFLPYIVRDYVNRALDQNPLYSGTIGPVQIQLIRGAYAINDVQLNKTTGNVPVPLFAAKQIKFSIQWNALLHKRLVTRIEMYQPQINFVDSPSDANSQAGGGGPWLKMLQDLSPFKINRAELHEGSVHFRTYKSQKPVDVYVSQVEGSIDNLSNIRNETTPLNATVQATGMVMDQAKLELKMTLDPFSYYPTFHLGLRLVGLDVTKINDLALEYGKFDFKHGWFDLVIETDSNEGRISGYVKPLFRDLKVFSIGQDLKEDSALQFFWQALLGAVTKVFKNQPRNQFGTLVPFTGDVTGSTNPDILATILNVLRNAFVRAYLPRLENGTESIGGLNFSPPSVTSPDAGVASP